MRAAAKIGAEAREAAELRATENKAHWRLALTLSPIPTPTPTPTLALTLIRTLKAHWRKALEELKDKERQGKAMHAEIVKLGNRPLKELSKAP